MFTNIVIIFFTSHLLKEEVRLNNIKNFIMGKRDVRKVAVIHRIFVVTQDLTDL